MAGASTQHRIDTGLEAIHQIKGHKCLHSAGEAATVSRFTTATSTRPR
jgi:hypothetical protein